MSDTRERIITAMFNLIAELGYEKASIGRIAEAVGIKKASIYYYYKKKEEILFDLIDDCIDSDELDYTFYETSNYEEYKMYLKDFGLVVIDEYTANGTLRKVCGEIYLLCTRNEAVREKMYSIEANHRELFEKYFKHGINIKVLPADYDIHNNSKLITLIFAGIDSVIMSGQEFDTKTVWINFVDKVI